MAKDRDEGEGGIFQHLGGFFTRTFFYGAGLNYGSGSFPVAAYSRRTFLEKMWEAA